MNKHKVKLADITGAGSLRANGDVRVARGSQAPVTADLGDQNVSYGASQAVVAARQLTLPDHPSFVVSGTTPVAIIDAKPDGTTLRLRFVDDRCVVEDRHINTNGDGNIYLSLGHYVSKADGGLWLYCEGGKWYEDHRSNLTQLDVWFRPDAALGSAGQVITTDLDTYAQWNTMGYLGQQNDPIGLLRDNPTPASLDSTLPRSNVAIWMPYVGLYFIQWGITFETQGGGVPSHGYRKAQLGLVYPNGVPDGSTTSWGTAIGDGNQVVATQFTDNSFTFTNSISTTGTTGRVNNTATDYDSTIAYSNVDELIKGDLYEIAKKLAEIAADIKVTASAPAAGEGEITLVGSTSLYSDGTNFLTLSCRHNQGADLRLSAEPYETFLHLIFRGY